MRSGMRTATGVIVGAVLPLLLGATLGNLTTDSGKHTWAYPMTPTAFLLLSVGLAVSHLLVMFGYLEVGRRSTGVARPLALVAAVGSAVLVVSELWSGLLARTALDAGVITALTASYAVASSVVLVGTLGAGVVLGRARSTLAAPLLLNGLLLLAAEPVRFLASDGWGVAALTVWSVSYTWLGLRLRPRTATVLSASDERDHRLADHR